MTKFFVRQVKAIMFLLALMVFAVPGAMAAEISPQDVIQSWYKLMLELVRHTPTYTPPVASRSFAYLGVTAFETVASGATDMRSLAGQLNELKTVPERAKGKPYDETVVLQSALAAAAHDYFSNTGPSGQRAMNALEVKLRAQVSTNLKHDVVMRSEAYGKLVAAHIFKWSRGDGGADIKNMGFNADYKLIEGPAHWVPTNHIGLQQTPLLPSWGKNRPFAMPAGTTCPLPPPPAYSEDKNSEFYKQALEVYQTSKTLTPDQRMIAKFWADDAMLSTTPPGHWISIALQIFDRDKTDLHKSVDVMARLGVVLGDAFIGCWDAKYQYDLVRPITYIKRVIDPKWETLLNTPPFPEYPSGHSTQSGAAATVMTNLFGDNFAFSDNTIAADGIPARQFKDFWAAANDAGISRMYGGIHFRAAIDQGLSQGRCIGQFTNALKTKR